MKVFECAFARLNGNTAKRARTSCKMQGSIKLAYISGAICTATEKNIILEVILTDSVHDKNL
jgi:hypothetical protein